MNRITLALMTVAVLVAGAAPAHAQPAPWEPDRLTAGWTFVPAVGLGGLWDSNSTLRVTGDPQLGEWAGLINPRGELNFNGPRTRFVLGYSGSLEAYERLRELTRYDQRGRLLAQHKVTPRLTLQAQSALSVSPTTERLELGTLPFENVGSTLYEARGGGDYAVSQRTSVTAEYQFQWIRFDRDPTIGVLTGGSSNNGIGSIRHAFTSRFSAGGIYTYRVANTGGRARNVTVQDALAIAVVRLAEHTTLEGGAGVAYLQIHETGETRRGPSLRANLRHGLNRARVELAYEKSFVPSWSFGGTTTNEELRATLAVPFARGRGSVQGSTAFRHNEPLTSQGDRITLDSWWTGGSVGFALARWIRVEGFYSGSFQNSSARGEIDRTRIGIQFVTLKPVRIQ